MEIGLLGGIGMCGRYTLTVTIEELMWRYLFEGSLVPFHQPRYNVTPGQMIMAVIHDGRQRRAGELKWGLIPSWAKDDKIAYKTINAKAETVADKPAFATPFRRKRCLIPADSFYEWKKEANGKQPMRIMLKSQQIFSIAGLYDTWLTPDGTKISTCTVITTAPNRLMEPIHNRMPVILHPEDEAVWLDRERHPDELKALLRPYPEAEMTAYPVSPLVGSVKNDTAACIDPLE